MPLKRLWVCVRRTSWQISNIQRVSNGTHMWAKQPNHHNNQFDWTKNPSERRSGEKYELMDERLPFQHNATNFSGFFSRCLSAALQAVLFHFFAACFMAWEHIVRIRSFFFAKKRHTLNAHFVEICLHKNCSLLDSEFQAENTHQIFDLAIETMCFSSKP